jgi:hypothetical protein
MILLLCLLTQDFSVIDSGTRWAKPGESERSDRITEEATLKTLWDRLPSSPKRKDLPKVDFTRNMVIAVIPSLEADRKELKIESMTKEKGILTLTYSLTPIDIRGGPGFRLPYALIEVPRSAHPLRVVELTRDPAGGKILQERIVKTLEALK